MEDVGGVALSRVGEIMFGGPGDEGLELAEVRLRGLRGTVELRFFSLVAC